MKQTTKSACQSHHYHWTQFSTLHFNVILLDLSHSYQLPHKILHAVVCPIQPTNTVHCKLSALTIPRELTEL